VVAKITTRPVASAVMNGARWPGRAGSASQRKPSTPANAAANGSTSSEIDSPTASATPAIA
jgi:hypothetical protein